MDKRSIETRISLTIRSEYERLCERAAIDLMTGYEKAPPFVLDEDWDRFVEEFPNAENAHGEAGINLHIESEHFDRISQITGGNISKKDLLGAMLRWCVRDDRRSDFNSYLIENTESPEITPGSSITEGNQDFGTDKYMEMNRDEIREEAIADIQSLGEPDE